MQYKYTYSFQLSSASGGDAVEGWIRGTDVLPRTQHRGHAHCWRRWQRSIYNGEVCVCVCVSVTKKWPIFFLTKLFLVKKKKRKCFFGKKNKIENISSSFQTNIFFQLKIMLSKKNLVTFSLQTDRQTAPIIYKSRFLQKWKSLSLFHNYPQKWRWSRSVKPTQVTEGSASCDGCNCPLTIRLNPTKASNTTVITSPRNCYDVYNHDYDNWTLSFLFSSASPTSTQRIRTASGRSM